jgi:hypothetical protein
MVEALINDRPIPVRCLDVHIGSSKQMQPVLGRIIGFPTTRNGYSELDEGAAQ